MENQQSVTTLTHQEFRNKSNDVLLKFTKSVINLETEIGQNSNAEPVVSQGPTSPSYIMEPPLRVNDDANLEQRFKKPCSDNLATKRQRNVDNAFPKPSFLEDTIGKKNILENESSTACNIQLSRVYFSQKDQHENFIMQETKDMEPKVDTGRHRQRHLYYPELSQGNSYKIADSTTQDAFYHHDSPVKTSQNKKNSNRILLIDAPLKNYRHFLSGSEDWEKGSASLERIQEDKNDNDFEQDTRFLSDEEDFDICDNNEKVEETSTNMNKPSRGDSKDACEMRVVVDSNGRIMVINRDDDQPLNKTPRLTIKQYGKKRKDQTQFLTNEEQENKCQGPYLTPNQTKQLYVNKKEDSVDGAKQLQDDHQRLPRRSEEHFVLAGEDGKHAFYYVSSQEDSKCSYKLYPLHDNCYIDQRQTEPPFVLTPSEKMLRFINKHGSNHLNEHEQQAQSFDTSNKEPFIDNRKYEKQQCPVHSNTHLQQLWSHGGLEAPTMVSHSNQVTDERPNELHIAYSNKYGNKNLESPIHSKISRDSVNNNHFEQKRAPCPIHGRINFDKSSRLNDFVSQELSPAPFDERRAKCPIHGTKASEQHFINSSSERERSYPKVPQQLSSVPFDERRAKCPIHGTKASVDDSEKSEKVNNAIHSKMIQEQMFVPVENKKKRPCPIHSTDLSVNVPSLQETNENLSETNSDENIGNDMQISNEESEKPETLEMSREKENDGNRYRCDWPACTKAFRHYSFLVLHRRIHTGERPYYCSWKGCNKQFRRSDDYQRHYRVHTGVKPYPCSICGKAFKRSDHRLFHYRAIHCMYMPKSKP